MSLLSVLRLDGVGMPGRAAAFADDDGIEPWLAEETCRDCLGRWVAYVGLAGSAVGAGGNCSGGSTSGDLERLRDDPARDRLRERPRMRDVMALNKVSSAGEVGERRPREYVDVGDSISGDAVPEDRDFCELLVPVRMGGGGWKRSVS